MSRFLAAATTLAAPFAFAHPGHAMPTASHWHATDVAGFILLGVVATAALAWVKSRKK